jgi:hypothetical protein
MDAYLSEPVQARADLPSLETYNYLIGMKLVSGRDTLCLTSLDVNTRIIRPMSLVSMDYNPNRLTIYLDSHDIVTTVKYC